MRKIRIQDLKPGLVPGVEVLIPSAKDAYKEGNFEWTPSSLVAKFKTAEVSGGVLYAWHHVPVFHEVETHIDAETFYFISGVALMPFVDLRGGRPDIETVQVVRILPGTQIIISPEKGHFVAVAESSEPVHAVVVSPKMEAPRVPLPDQVEGYE